MQPPRLLDLVHTAIGEVFGPTHAEARLAAYRSGGDGDFHQAPLTTRQGLHAKNTHITIRGLPTIITTYRQAHEAQDDFHRPIVLLIVHAATNHGPLKREFEFLPIPRELLYRHGAN